MKKPVPPEPAEGVSFLIPVHNGEAWLARVLDSVLAQADGRPMEVIVVDDHSSDASSAILQSYVGRIRIVAGPGRGATAALNEGIRHARYPILCQVDQDVILHPGWMAEVVARLADPTVGAAQGYYVTPPDGTIWSQVMGLDLESRYRSLLVQPIDHVCTGNTAYRVHALREVGLFDETLGYGYDNDLSYRLVAAGYTLVIVPEARSIHRWRDDWKTYLIQQYGFGYGRLDLVAKHRTRITGDHVSALAMMLHAPVMALAVTSAVLAPGLFFVGISPLVPALVALGCLAALGLERLIAGVAATLRFRHRAGLWFVPVHLCRDLAWVAALAVWSVRRLRGLSSRPSDSMHPRQPLRQGTARIPAARRSSGAGPVER